MRRARRPSRRGCAATSGSSSATTSVWRPRAKVGGGAFLERGVAQLLQVRDLRGERVGLHVGEGLAAPELERVVVGLAGALLIAGAGRGAGLVQPSA